ncbi:hypothetical protein GRI89_10700 [Altererythrobacter salegens]|uniref:Ferrochelatase n=1 Tax=Croceibacterium salegens TaxID=1737568 RepID=A0A6I4SYA2_9SPHN|nr:hypothetical protein [Croceibacterium salegens]MXO60007.1 hypothetical protein [Croceibacterium salegens]
MKTFLAATAAFGLVASPVTAQAAEAARESTPINASERFAGDGTFLYVVIAAVAIVAGILILSDDNNNDLPTSP